MPKVTEILVSDSSTGEVLVEKTVWGSRSKGGWVMFYQEAGLELIAQAPTPAVLKVFMYLAMGQTYEGGMKTTKSAVQKKLGLSKPTIIGAFNWLKSSYIIHEWRTDGCTEFLINPVYVCIGKFDERMRLWKQRTTEYLPMYSSAQYHRHKQAAIEASKLAEKSGNAS